eukprot:gene22971-24293_t
MPMPTAPDSQKHDITIWYVLFVVGALIAMQWLWESYSLVETFPYGQFETRAADGRITSVTVSDNLIQGKLKEPAPGGATSFLTVRVDPDLTEHLTAKGISVTGVASSGILSSILSWVLPAIVFYMIWSFLIRRIGN